MSAIVITDTLAYRVACIRTAIKLYKSTGLIPTRGVTISKLLTHAGQFSGKVYKRGQYDLAIADLNAWLDRRAQEVEA